MQTLNKYLGFLETKKSDVAYFKLPRETTPFVLTFALEFALRNFKQTSRG